MCSDFFCLCREKCSDGRSMAALSVFAFSKSTSPKGRGKNSTTLSLGSPLGRAGKIADFD